MVARDGAARAGRLHTSSGIVETPAFIPLATRGSVRSLTAGEVAELGFEMVLGNTFHLMLAPGADRIARLGGLHRFMGWDRAILTDSGGYQVFSLRDTAAIADDGVEFRSVYDGSRHRFTPELAMEIQRNLGSDIAMAFDECPPAGVERARLEDAVRRTSEWAGRCRACEPAPGQLVFGIVQGGIDLELRRRSAAHIVS